MTEKKNLKKESPKAKKESPKETRGRKAKKLTIQDCHDSVRKAIVMINTYAKQVKEAGSNTRRFEKAASDLNRIIRFKLR